MNERLTLRMSVEATYAAHGTPAGRLKDLLEDVVQRGLAEGLLTGETEAELIAIGIDVAEAQPVAADADVCDECGTVIPASDGGGLANRHHRPHCSLHDPEEE